LVAVACFLPGWAKDVSARGNNVKNTHKKTITTLTPVCVKLSTHAEYCPDI